MTSDPCRTRNVGPGIEPLYESIRTRSSPRFFATGAMRKLVGVAVVECDDVGSGCVRETGDLGRKGGGRVRHGVVQGVVHDASTVSGSSGCRSSGMVMGAKALTSAPPVLPTGYLPVTDPGAATMIRKS